MHTFLKTYRRFIIFLFFLVVALGLRGIRYQAYPFGFDQIQIAQNANQIASGNLTLIGPRTGPADMFTGPLIYYLAGPFSLIVGPAYSTVAVALFISFLTGLTLFGLARKYLSPKINATILTLWALSPLLVKYDRVPWNPNLMFLASALTFIPFLKTKKLDWIDSLIIAAGVFLGYQAHFSGLFLLPLAGLGILLKRRFKLIITPVIGFGLSLAPTILFDLRNDWLNLNGFIQLVSNKDKVATYSIVQRLIQNMYIIIETTGKIFFQDTQLSLILSAGTTIWLIFLWQFFLRLKEKEKSWASLFQVIFSLLWITLTGTTMALYRGNNPEYYFFVTLPALLFVIAQVLVKTQVKLWTIILFLGFFSSLQTASLSKDLGLTIGSQYQVIKKIHQIDQSHPIGELVYDMEAVETLGLKYLLSQDPLSLSKPGEKVHIIHPNPELPYFDYNIAGSIGLWIDPRKNPNITYFTQDEFIIGLPLGWHFYKPTQASKSDLSEIYLIADSNHKTIRSLVLVTKEQLKKSKLTFNNQSIKAGIEADQNWKLTNSSQGKPHLKKRNNLYEFVVIGKKTPALSNIELYY